MFDIGWQELFIVGLIAIIVVGPRELPRVLRTVTLGIRKVRGMARDFQDGIDELAREADLADMRKEIEDASGADFKEEINSIADPARELEASVKEASESVNAPETTSTTAPKSAVKPPQPAAAAGDAAPGPGPEKKAGDGA